MECGKCNLEVTETDILVTITDKNQLDILIICPNCGNEFGTFVDGDDLTDY